MRIIIHKIKYISSSIEVPPFCLSVGMRVRHPHSYKDFLPKNTHRKKRGLERGSNDGMGGAASTHLISELQCDFAESDEKIDE
jgi:hypothetical protein